MSDKKAAFFFSFNLFIILTAYYQLKPLSRALFMHYIGSSNLPYVWITTTIILICLLPFFHWRLKHFSPQQVVNASCVSFIILLLLFHHVLVDPGTKSVVGFYVLIDVYSVVLIESFWSLTNSTFQREKSTKWYGLVASGALLGGSAGGVLASFLVSTPKLKEMGLISTDKLKEIDLLYVAIFFLVILLAINFWYRPKFHVSKESDSDAKPVKKLTPALSRSLMIIGFIVFLAQVVEPVAEYQFNNTVEANIFELSERTQYLAWFASVINISALLINLCITPFIHRFIGIFAGLYSQPFAVAGAAIAFLLSPTLLTIGILKVADRGLSYSLTRSSKEILYVPFNAILIHKAKIWIDLFGYRLFKIFGSLLLLALTRWFTFKLSVAELSWVLVAVATIWIILITLLRKYYNKLEIFKAQKSNE